MFDWYNILVELAYYVALAASLVIAHELAHLLAAIIVFRPPLRTLKLRVSFDGVKMKFRGGRDITARRVAVIALAPQVLTVVFVVLACLTRDVVFLALAIANVVASRRDIKLAHNVLRYGLERYKVSENEIIIDEYGGNKTVHVYDGGNVN